MVGRVTPPIFVADCDGVDVAAFRSVADAEAWIEPPDVLRGDFAAFDAQGRRLRAELKGRRTLLTVSEHAVPRDPELVARIKRLADATHLDIDASVHGWDEFIDSAATKIEAWMRE